MLVESYTLPHTRNTTNICGWWHSATHVYAIRAYVGWVVPLLVLLAALSIHVHTVAQHIFARSSQELPVVGTLHTLEWIWVHNRWTSNVTYSFVWHNQTQWGHSMFRDQMYLTSRNQHNALMSSLFSTYTNLPQTTTIFVVDTQPHPTNFFLQRKDPTQLLVACLALSSVHVACLLYSLGLVFGRFSSVRTRPESVPAFRAVLYPLQDNVRWFAVLCIVVCVSDAASILHMLVLEIQYIRLPKCIECTHILEIPMVFLTSFVSLVCAFLGWIWYVFPIRWVCWPAIRSPIRVHFWKEESSQFWDTEPSRVYFRLFTTQELSVRQITLRSELYSWNRREIVWGCKRSQVVCRHTLLEAHSDTYFTCAFTLSDAPILDSKSFWKLCVRVTCEDGHEYDTRVQVHTQQEQEVQV